MNAGILARKVLGHQDSALPLDTARSVRTRNAVFKTGGKNAVGK
jgi:hypothetical protein